MVSFGINLSNGGRIFRMFEIIGEIPCLYMGIFDRLSSLELTNTNYTKHQERNHFLKRVSKRSR